MTRLFTLIALVCAAVKAQSPSLQSFFATEAGNRAQVYAQLQGKLFPRPAFGAQLVAMTNVACGYTQIINNVSCLFSLTQAEAEVDLLAQNPPNGLGLSVIQINFDPYWLIDDTSGLNGSRTARSEFESVMDYIYNTYGAGSSTHTPTVHVRLAPSYNSANLGPACQALLSVAVNNPFQIPADLSTCVTSTSFNTTPGHCGTAGDTCGSWLKIGGTQYSLYGWLAAYFGPSGSPPSSCVSGSPCPVMQDFSDIHEPTTINGNFATYYPSFSGTAAQWQTAVSTMISTTAPNTQGVFNANSAVSNGIAFQGAELSYATSMLPLTQLIYVGGDNYSTAIGSSSSGLGGISAILSAAAAPPNNYRVLLTESWLPAWVPTSYPATDLNAYEGLGNCDWQTYDFIRQTLSATTMWASATGLTEVNFFSAANTSVACVYGGIGNGNDRITPPSTYLRNVIAPATAAGQRTKTFYWLQQMVNNWLTAITSGQPLPL